ncbi:hypothetical protein DFJ69_0310 [Thermomonospora umbrina]|uniref:Uncharacterized protein n=1 Tax=Thermomonospora umbrina TaxID=111806 RepID=A0A3D9STB3_9ACTN|nr:hypothetical protein DFJ69_0310 [Thermomonospora umbrina]
MNRRPRPHRRRPGQGARTEATGQARPTRTPQHGGFDGRGPTAQVEGGASPAEARRSTWERPPCLNTRGPAEVTESTWDGSPSPDGRGRPRRPDPRGSDPHGTPPAITAPARARPRCANRPGWTGTGGSKRPGRRGPGRRGRSQWNRSLWIRWIRSRWARSPSDGRGGAAGAAGWAWLGGLAVWPDRRATVAAGSVGPVAVEPVAVDSVDPVAVGPAAERRSRWAAAVAGRGGRDARGSGEGESDRMVDRVVRWGSLRAWLGGLAVWARSRWGSCGGGAGWA